MEQKFRLLSSSEEFETPFIDWLENWKEEVNPNEEEKYTVNFEENRQKYQQENGMKKK